MSIPAKSGLGEGKDKDEDLRVLLVEDSDADSELILRELKRAGFRVVSELVKSAEHFQQTLDRFVPDIVLADYNLGQWSGMGALELVRAKGWTCR
jgi:DNA-binding response OmpR family regulator